MKQSSVITVGPDRSYMQVVDKELEAFDRYRRTLTPVRVFDAGLAKLNRQWFEREILPSFEKLYGRAINESAQCLRDAETRPGAVRAPSSPELLRIIQDSEVPIADAASITSSNLANQPVVSLAIQIERFQQSLALALGAAVGPPGFVQVPLAGGGGVGAVLRVPVETYTPPAGNVEPDIGDELLGVEDAEIPEATIDLRFENFAPRWNRRAFSIPTEARQALANGPLNYDAVARGFFHITEHLRRVLDQAFLREVAQTADEFGKVAVASEVATTGDANLTFGAGGSQGGYGTNVVLVVKLRRGGTIAAPKTERPAVRTRTSKKLDADGFIASTVLNDASVSGAVGFTMVDREGYLENNEVKGTVGGLAATWAIDWEAGNFIATSVFGWDNGVADNFAISYTYGTNLDTWSKTVPSGREPAEYYDELLERLDRTAAALRASPHFTDADLALMSVTASVFFANARIFHSSASPKGSTLSDPDFAAARAVFADRNGIALVRHNIPWPLGDNRVIVGARGATKIGIDTALRTLGPFPRFSANMKLIAGDQFYVEENVVIATPLVKVPATGATKHSPYRSIRFIA